MIYNYQTWIINMFHYNLA